MSMIVALLTALHIAVHSKSKFGKISIGWTLLAGIWGGPYGFSQIGLENAMLKDNPQMFYTQAITLWAIFFGLYYFSSEERKQQQPNHAPTPRRKLYFRPRQRRLLKRRKSHVSAVGHAHSLRLAVG